jgi:hypothetical protein
MSTHESSSAIAHEVRELKHVAKKMLSDLEHGEQMYIVMRDRCARTEAYLAASEISIVELREQNRKLREALLQILNSAVPHPVEHPTMSKAWAKAEIVLKETKP